MTEQELDDKIDKATAEKVRQCLKYIVAEWFVEESYPMKAGAERVRTVNFDKELNSDTLEAVTSTLHTFGFSPKVDEGRTKFHKPNPPSKDPCNSCTKLGETTCGNDTTNHTCWEG